MFANVPLVDPLAALFRPVPRASAPLILDATHVAVTILAPLARVEISRRFTNRSDASIEAVLTLPPASPNEIVHGLSVTIDGTTYDAEAAPRIRAARAHDKAIAHGQRAILHEIVAGGAQLISICGIEPGAEVAVSVSSVRPLDRRAARLARLEIALTAHENSINRRLSDADALLTVEERHDATLSVVAAGLRVTLDGSNHELPHGRSTEIDCAAPFSLRINAIDDRTLDCTARDVERPGGWEAACGPRGSAFQPLGSLSARLEARQDWIYGYTGHGEQDIRIIAPMPIEGFGSLDADARAMTAFAADHFIEAARRVDSEALRHAAGLLNPRTSLRFIGPEGELSEAAPVLRKVALPALEPEIDRRLPTLPEPLIIGSPEEPPSSEPRAMAPRYSWFTWAPLALLSWWLLGRVGLVPAPTVPLFLAMAFLLILDAVRYFPRVRSPARRRLPLLTVLALPPIVSVLAGPLGFMANYSEVADQPWMLGIQHACLVASGGLPFALLPAMGGGKRLTLITGALAFMLTFVTTSVCFTIIAPGS